MKSLTLICAFLSIKISKNLPFDLQKWLFRKWFYNSFLILTNRSQTGGPLVPPSWTGCKLPELTYKLVVRVSFFHSNRLNSTPYCLLFPLFFIQRPKSSCHLVGYSLNPSALICLGWVLFYLRASLCSLCPMWDW